MGLLIKSLNKSDYSNFIKFWLVGKSKQKTAAIFFNTSTAYAMAIHMLKANKRSIRTNCVICLTLTLKTQNDFNDQAGCLCCEFATNFAPSCFVYDVDFK